MSDEGRCAAPGCGLHRGHGIYHATSPETADKGETWTDLRATRLSKAEFHLTYACDLDCSSCNRASFLRKPHTRSMNLTDALEFFEQADGLGWKPSEITFVGGEPTLHPDFLRFVEVTQKWLGKPVQVWSNAYRPKARELVQIASRRLGASICQETQKPDGAVRSKGEGEYWVEDIYVSPADYGVTRDPCFQHASVICGIGVDAEGYSPCAMGGTTAGILGAKSRTKILADLFDREKVAEMTAEMCRDCGHQYMSRRTDLVDIKALPRRFDTPMSPTWERAFEGRE